MGEVYNIFCSGRVNPPQDHAIAAAGTAQQTLRIEIGSGPNDIVNGEDALPGKFIILYRSRHLLDDDVGINAQDLIAQAVGKTGKDRQDDNESDDSDGDPAHGNERDQGNKTMPVFGTEIAQADEPFENHKTLPVA